MKVITLNKDLFLIKCEELHQKINLKPDIVIGILNGGRFVCNTLIDKQNFNKNIQLIKPNRYNRLKKYRRIFKPLLKVLPYKVLDKFRIYESNKSRRSMQALKLDELSNLKVNIDLRVSSAQSILIVDDAIDTGRTMFIMKNNVQKLFPNAEIKTAVISWTIDTSFIVPDFYIFKNTLVRFPWSLDYNN